MEKRIYNATNDIQANGKEILRYLTNPAAVGNGTLC